MSKDYFKSLENLPHNTPVALDTVLEHLAFNEEGLIPVIAQDIKSKDVVMFAWMNLEALRRTLATNRMTYWSRSRQSFWVKGETSGNTQTLVSMTFDCDGDVVLCKIEQSGPACHTLRPGCFYLKVDADNNKVLVTGEPVK